jgi:hypothetical protein
MRISGLLREYLVFRIVALSFRGWINQEVTFCIVASRSKPRSSQEVVANEAQDRCCGDEDMGAKITLRRKEFNGQN